MTPKQSAVPPTGSRIFAWIIATDAAKPTSIVVRSRAASPRIPRLKPRAPPAIIVRTRRSAAKLVSALRQRCSAASLFGPSDGFICRFLVNSGLCLRSGRRVLASTIAADGGYEARFRRQQSYETKRTTVCFDIGWRRAEVKRPPTDLLNVVNEHFPNSSLEITTEALSMRIPSSRIDSFTASPSNSTSIAG